MTQTLARGKQGIRADGLGFKVGGSVRVDREDARFAADALEARLQGNVGECERLAASCLVRLMGAAQVIRRLAGAAPPAVLAADRLEAIAKDGGKAVDLPADDDEKIIVDSLRKLAAEPPMPRNRHDRRKAAKLHLPRRERLVGVRAPLTVH